jgi:hypothetical protein
MPRFLCSSCHEVIELSGSMRFEWCSACGEPLSAEDRLPVRLVTPQQAQASSGSAGPGAELAAPALATTTSPMAASSRPASASPPTT